MSGHQAAAVAPRCFLMAGCVTPEHMGTPLTLVGRHSLQAGASEGGRANPADELAAVTNEICDLRSWSG